MNESLARKFCESPYRPLIVTIATVVLMLVAVLPMVDDYYNNKRSHTALVENLARASETVETLPMFQQRAEALGQRLAELDALSVNEKNVGDYRSRLVDLVRESGCQMRKIDVSKTTRRTWMEDDSPLVEKQPSGTENKPTPFMLERRNVVLSVDGTTANVNTLLEKLQEESTFIHPRRLKFHSVGRDGNKVTMEVELWLFALAQKTA